MSSMYIRWLIFFCDLLSLYPPVHFQSMWLSGIIAITNRKGDSASPWNILLWIFASDMLFPLAVSSTLQILINFLTSFDILYILRQFIIQLCWTIPCAFLLSIHAIARFFVSSSSRWGCADQDTVAPVPLSTYGILSVPRGRVRVLLTISKSTPLFAPFVFFTI